MVLYCTAPMPWVYRLRGGNFRANRTDRPEMIGAKVDSDMLMLQGWLGIQYCLDCSSDLRLGWTSPT